MRQQGKANQTESKHMNKPLTNYDIQRATQLVKQLAESLVIRLAHDKVLLLADLYSKQRELDHEYRSAKTQLRDEAKQVLFQ